MHHRELIHATGTFVRVGPSDIRWCDAAPTPPSATLLEPPSETESRSQPRTGAPRLHSVPEDRAVYECPIDASASCLQCSGTWGATTVKWRARRAELFFRFFFWFLNGCPVRVCSQWRDVSDCDEAVMVSVGAGCTSAAVFVSLLPCGGSTASARSAWRVQWLRSLRLTCRRSAPSPTTRRIASTWSRSADCRLGPFGGSLQQPPASPLHSTTTRPSDTQPHSHRSSVRLPLLPFRPPCCPVCSRAPSRLSLALCSQHPSVQLPPPPREPSPHPPRPPRPADASPVRSRTTSTRRT